MDPNHDHASPESSARPAFLDSADTSPLIRTDFTDDDAWRAIKEQVSAPLVVNNQGSEYTAGVEFVDDRRYDGLTPGRLFSLVGEPPPYYVYIADRETMTDPEHPILAVDTGPTVDNDTNFRRGDTFRLIPAAMATVEANLSIANVDFVDYVDSASPDGVYRETYRGTYPR